MRAFAQTTVSLKGARPSPVAVFGVSPNTCWPICRINWITTRKSRHILSLFLLQVEKVRMRTGFKNAVPFKSNLLPILENSPKIRVAIVCQLPTNYARGMV
jgi:hypothetical protein